MKERRLSRIALRQQERDSSDEMDGELEIEKRPIYNNNNHNSYNNEDSKNNSHNNNVDSNINNNINNYINREIDMNNGEIYHRSKNNNNNNNTLGRARRKASGFFRKSGEKDSEFHKLLTELNTITEVVDRMNRHDEIEAEWKAFAKVLDRLFFVIFLIIFFVSSASVILFAL